MEKQFGSYVIHDDGKVYSNKTQKYLKLVNYKGYKRVALTENGKTKAYNVHRLVALLFIPNPDNKPVVNHINGIRDDNRIENLEWCTYRENIQNAVDRGTLASEEWREKYYDTISKTKSLFAKIEIDTAEKFLSIIEKQGLTYKDWLNQKIKEAVENEG